MLNPRNMFQLDGNLVRDPEIRYTPGGAPVAYYTVAATNVYYDGEKRVEETDFIPVQTYGRQAENDGKYLKKGSGVTVGGSIRSWYDREKKKGGFNFKVTSVIYRGQPRGNGGAAAPEASGPAPDKDHDDWLREFDGQAGSAN